MRSFLTFVVFAGLGAAYLWQKQHEDKPTAATTPTVANHSSASPAPATVSEHNWMKRSLDRATEVRDTARRQTKEAQDP